MPILTIPALVNTKIYLFIQTNCSKFVYIKWILSTQSVCIPLGPFLETCSGIIIFKIYYSSRKQIQTSICMHSTFSFNNLFFLQYQLRSTLCHGKVNVDEDATDLNYWRHIATQDFAATLAAKRKLSHTHTHTAK